MRVGTLMLRRLHKWTGIVVGLQLVLWALSGAMMAQLDMDEVAGGPLPAAAAPPLPQAGGWAEVRRALGPSPVSAVAVRPLLDRHVIEVESPAGVRLFDAASGTPVAVDSALARRIAVAAHPAAAQVRAVVPLARIELAVREHRLPIWRIDFADRGNSSFYVSAADGTLLERRNDAWRRWDFFWMLHNMDYLNRSSFNHPLIVVMGIASLWLAVTGFWLLFRTAWRPDLRALRYWRRRRS